MRTPLYTQHNAPTNPGDGHKGLWFERFFNQYDYDSNWGVIAANPQAHTEEGKKKWIGTVAGNCGDRQVLESFAVHQANLCAARDGQSRAFLTDWHFATGLGNPHPVENGFAWHPTLGVPYLTGAAVKGIVRAWVEGWMSPEDFPGANESEREINRLATLYRWFGSEDKDFKKRKELREADFSPPSQGRDLDTEAGAFVFFDAIPLKPVTLACNVMTPHYGKWYEKGGEIQNAASEPDKVPADWHDPVPVPFLVVKAGSFLFSIAPRTAQAQADISTVIKALQDALAYLGAGAKTAVGYGAMSRDISSEGDLRRLQEEQEGQAQAAAEAARMEAERKQMLSTMDPFDRRIQEIADARIDKTQSEISFMLNLAKTGQWEGEERIKVARWLEKRMRKKKGEWREQSQKKKSERDKQYQNTLLVKGWLAER